MMSTKTPAKTVHVFVGSIWLDLQPERAAVETALQRLRGAGDIGLNQEVTLPTEAQWEKVARGEDGRIFSWGDEFDATKCNVDNTDIGTTSAVGIFPAGASPYGVLDLSGNVWEWCRTKWRGSYKELADESLEGDVSCVLRGRSFSSDQRNVRCDSAVGSHKTTVSETMASG